VFWIGISIAFIAGLISIGLSRETVKGRFSVVKDYHLDIVALVLLIIGLIVSGYEHRQDEMMLKELNAGIKPRHLSIDQRLAIQSVLSVIPENLKGLYVCSLSFDEEAASYLKDFKEVFQELGFKIVKVPALRGGIGVRILTRPNTITETISPLSDALSKAGIDFTMGALEEAGTIKPESFGPFPCLYIGPK
jgi:hypothetical protein